MNEQKGHSHISWDFVAAVVFGRKYREVREGVEVARRTAKDAAGTVVGAVPVVAERVELEASGVVRALGVGDGLVAEGITDLGRGLPAMMGLVASAVGGGEAAAIVASPQRVGLAVQFIQQFVRPDGHPDFMMGGVIVGVPVAAVAMIGWIRGWSEVGWRNFNAMQITAAIVTVGALGMNKLAMETGGSGSWEMRVAEGLLLAVASGAGYGLRRVRGERLEREARDQQTEETDAAVVAGRIAEQRRAEDNETVGKILMRQIKNRNRGQLGGDGIELAHTMAGMCVEADSGDARACYVLRSLYRTGQMEIGGRDRWPKLGVRFEPEVLKQVVRYANEEFDLGVRSHDL